MKSETISDIVREMRLHTRCSAADAFYDIVAWTKLCDRIEAAAKRENEREADCTNCDYANVVADNERLRAALKPVLEFDENAHHKMLESLRAVREAQRIYKEGEAND